MYLSFVWKQKMPDGISFIPGNKKEVAKNSVFEESRHAGSWESIKSRSGFYQHTPKAFHPAFGVRFLFKTVSYKIKCCQLFITVLLPCTVQWFVHGQGLRKQFLSEFAVVPPKKRYRH